LYEKKHCHLALQLSVTKQMRFECWWKLSECNVRLSQTVPWARSSSSEWAQNTTIDCVVVGMDCIVRLSILHWKLDFMTFMPLEIS